MSLIIIRRGQIIQFDYDNNTSWWTIDTHQALCQPALYAAAIVLPISLNWSSFLCFSSSAAWCLSFIASCDTLCEVVVSLARFSNPFSLRCFSASACRCLIFTASSRASSRSFFFSASLADNRNEVHSTYKNSHARWTQITLHETLVRCWAYVGPASQTVDQY